MVTLFSMATHYHHTNCPPPNHALHLTRPSRPGCNRTPSWAGSLSLGRWTDAVVLLSTHLNAATQSPQSGAEKRSAKGANRWHRLVWPNSAFLRALCVSVLKLTPVSTASFRLGPSAAAAITPKDMRVARWSCHRWFAGKGLIRSSPRLVRGGGMNAAPRVVGSRMTSECGSDLELGIWSLELRRA